MEWACQYGSFLYGEYAALESFKQVGGVYGEVFHFGRIETRRGLDSPRLKPIGTFTDIPCEAPQAAISRIYDGTSSSRSNRNSYPPSRDDSATVDEALLPSASSSSPSSSSTRRSTSRTNGVNRTNGMGTGVIGLYYLRQVSVLSTATIFPLNHKEKLMERREH